LVALAANLMGLGPVFRHTCGRLESTPMCACKAHTVLR
jgi:hypothetical protein